MTDLLTQVENYINSEKTLKFAIRIEVSKFEQKHNRFEKEKYEEHIYENFDKSDKRPRWEKKEYKLSLFKYNNYTPLNFTHTNILIEIRNRNIVNWPSQLKGNPNLRDRKKYYHFYMDHIHDAKDCRTLKDEMRRWLEEVIWISIKEITK